MALPKKYKCVWTAQLQQLFQAVPSLEVLEELFQRLDEVTLCIKDLQGRYLTVNNAFMRTVPRLTREEVLGKTAFDVYPKALAASYQQQDLLLLSRGRSLHDQLEMITNPDGTLGWYLTSKVLVRDGDGRVLAIVGMSRDLHAASEKDERYGKVLVALTKIQTCYHQPLRVAQLAKESGLSVSQFERLMLSLVQVTPRQYLTRRRVEAAALLLQTTDKKLANIAIECGFPDQASFSRQFHKMTGFPPLKYRQANASQ